VELFNDGLQRMDIIGWLRRNCNRLRFPATVSW
jgi:hypothetical protein